MPEVFTWPVGRAGDDEQRLLAQRRAPLKPIAVFVVSSALAGAAAASLLAVAGAALSNVVVLHDGGNYLAAALAALAILLELGQRVSPLPQPQRQVPREWTLWPSRTVTGAAFGGVIGAGVFTFFQHATIYVFGLALLASPTMSAAAACGAVYGLTRAAPVPITWVVNVWRGKRIPWYRLSHMRGRVSLVLAAVSVATLCGWF